MRAFWGRPTPSRHFQSAGTWARGKTASPLVTTVHQRSLSLPQPSLCFAAPAPQFFGTYRAAAAAAAATPAITTAARGAAAATSQALVGLGREATRAVAESASFRASARIHAGGFEAPLVARAAMH